ncbi:MULTISPECIES: hypothetical protein [Candidatus Ichthyocystis]|uniref:hypothetical protein n=1 Tax=Candidatus Ichthyocystis TaxID=2929841 RepID=UPI000B84F8AA|nr:MULTISPECIES: hypothetical protein [Ichthyocystis]
MYQFKSLYCLPLLFFLVACSSLFSRYSASPYGNETAKLVIPPTMSHPQYDSTYDLSGVIKRPEMVDKDAVTANYNKNNDIDMVVTANLRLSEDVSGITVFVPEQLKKVMKKTSDFFSYNGFSVSSDLKKLELHTKWKKYYYYNKENNKFFGVPYWGFRDRYHVIFHAHKSGTFVSFAHREESSYISFLMDLRNRERTIRQSSSWHNCSGCGLYSFSYLIPRYLSLFGANPSGINRLMLLRYAPLTKVEKYFRDILFHPFLMIISKPVRESWFMTKKAIVRSGIQLSKEDFANKSFTISYLDPSFVPQNQEGIVSKISRFLGSTPSSSADLVKPKAYLIRLSSLSGKKVTQVLVYDSSGHKIDTSQVALRILEVISNNYS